MNIEDRGMRIGVRIRRNESKEEIRNIQTILK